MLFHRRDIRSETAVIVCQVDLIKARRIFQDLLHKLFVVHGLMRVSAGKTAAHHHRIGIAFFDGSVCELLEPGEFFGIDCSSHQFRFVPQFPVADAASEFLRHPLRVYGESGFIRIRTAPDTPVFFLQFRRYRPAGIESEKTLKFYSVRSAHFQLLI